MKTLQFRNSFKRSPLPIGFILFAVLLACFALVQNTQAISPAPDGGYPGGNTAEGQAALLSLTTGGFNTAIGFFSLRSDTTGQFNTALGAGTLLANTADGNTATGAAALLSNTTGADNTANGAFALFSNTTGGHNSAIGIQALLNNTTGGDNTAIGRLALAVNTTGSGNTAIGWTALASNTTGLANTAIGYQALFSNTTQNANEAIGYQALFSNTIGYDNTAIGYQALGNNTTGTGNTAVGINAGAGVTTANGVICVGHSGDNVSSTTWIANVYGITTQSGTTAPVIVSDHGQLGTVVSSERFKKDITTMEKASEAILSLRPVTFHYKSDVKDIPQFGLIAEEVAKVNPALVLPDKEGKPYTVRYDAVNAMLLNEFLKEHRKVEDLEKGMAALAAQLKEQAAQIQKVSAHLEMGTPTTNVVLNNP